MLVLTSNGGSTWNGTAKFIDPATIAVADMDLFTDAAGHVS